MRKYLILSVVFAFVHSSCMSSNMSSRSPIRKGQIVTVVKKVPSRSHRRNSKVVVKKVVIGTRVRTLPARHIIVYFHKIPFIYSEGTFYRQLDSSEYEVIKPEIGMMVPELPEYNVEMVKINDEKLFLFDGVLFKQVPTSDGLQYKVTGFMEK